MVRNQTLIFTYLCYQIITSTAFTSIPPDQLSANDICNNMNNSSLCDPDNLLSKNERDIVSAAAEQIYATVKCSNCATCQTNFGLRVNVVVLRTVNGNITTFGKDLLNRMRSNASLCTNDLLFVVQCKHDNSSAQLIIVAGEIALVRLSLACLSEAKAAASSALTNGNLSQALQASFNSIKKSYVHDPNSKQQLCGNSSNLSNGVQSNLSTTVVILIGFSIALIVAIAIFLGWQYYSHRRQSYLDYRPDLNGTNDAGVLSFSTSSGLAHLGGYTRYRSDSENQASVPNREQDFSQFVVT